MDAITCPYCSNPFVPVAGFASATCPHCRGLMVISPQPAQNPFDFRTAPPPVRRKAASSDPFAFDDADNLPIRNYTGPRLRPGSGMGIASVSLGVVAFCFGVLTCGFVFFGVIALPCAILAIVFGFVGSGSEGHGMATAGICLGVVSLILPILAMAVGMATVAATWR